MAEEPTHDMVWVMSVGSQGRGGKPSDGGGWRRKDRGWRDEELVGKGTLKVVRKG